MLFRSQVCGYELGDFIWTGGDIHLYSNHLEQAKIQISRKPYAFPEMKINPNVTHIDDFVYEDFELINYVSHPAIKAAISK